jgi:hypothetical protein
VHLISAFLWSLQKPESSPDGNVHVVVIWLRTDDWRKDTDNSNLERMPSSGMLRRVALVRTDDSGECIASVIKEIICELGTTLVVSSNRSTLRRNTMDMYVCIYVCILYEYLPSSTVTRISVKLEYKIVDFPHDHTTDAEGEYGWRAVHSWPWHYGDVAMKFAIGPF